MNVVQLVQIPDATFDKFNQNESFDNGISGCANGETFVLRFLFKDSEGISEITAHLTCHCNTYFVFSRLFFFLLNFLKGLHLNINPI